MSANITGATVSKPTNTFVIRVWREWSTEGASWRGSIEHLESKKRSGFQDFERMLAFFFSLGIFSEEEHKDDEEN